MERLFELPPFVLGASTATPGELAAGFALTGYFLDRHIWAARPVDPPATRASLLAILCDPV
jgi:DNA repair protein RecO (recombination protein O)